MKTVYLVVVCDGECANTRRVYKDKEEAIEYAKSLTLNEWELCTIIVEEWPVGEDRVYRSNNWVFHANWENFYS